MVRTAPVDPGPDAPAIEAARRRLEGIARRTPLERSRWLSDVAGVPVHLKLECWQRTGSFKLRGACNAVAALDPDARARGLVTASAGNHGQAVALAAHLHATTATVFVPESAPEVKKTRIRSFGADLREVKGGYDDAARVATRHAEAAGATYVHPFSDEAVVAGQATVALEIVDELPDVREVLVPVGGGGLAAGVGRVLADLGGARATGVQSTATRAMYDAFATGTVGPVEDVPTLCDGLAGEVEAVSYARARDVLHAVRLVDEDAIAPAIRALYQREGVVAEGAGAVGVAAVLQGVVALDGPTVVIVSGGNIDGARLARILTDG